MWRIVVDNEALARKLDVLIHLSSLTVMPDADVKVRARVLRDAGVDVEYLAKTTGLTAASIHALGVSGRKRSVGPTRKKVKR